MSIKILIIDDDPGDIKLFKKALCASDPSYDIYSAKSGEEGIEIIPTIKPDIVLLDTQLPGMDGFETCKKIKNNCDENVKVIVVTGVIDSIDALKAREMGCDDYCAKSTDTENLIQSIKQLILIDKMGSPSV